MGAYHPLGTAKLTDPELLGQYQGLSLGNQGMCHVMSVLHVQGKQMLEWSGTGCKDKAGPQWGLPKEYHLWRGRQGSCGSRSWAERREAQAGAPSWGMDKHNISISLCLSPWARVNSSSINPSHLELS
jgi:hypothetical protein